MSLAAGWADIAGSPSVDQRHDGHRRVHASCHHGLGDVGRWTGARVAVAQSSGGRDLDRRSGGTGGVEGVLSQARSEAENASSAPEPSA